MRPFYGSAVLLVSLACQSTPEPAGGASSTGSAPATASVAASSTAATPPPASTPSASASAASDCATLRKAVVDEAKQLAPCEKDENCEVHPTPLCAFDELDCYAVHVHKDRKAEALDKAVADYAATCPMSKCKCDVPSKSVCREGTCSAP